MKPTGPTNPLTRQLIRRLKKLSTEKKVPIWADLAEQLAKPSRQRAVVNVGKLEKLCKAGDVVIVLGKLLAGGTIKKAIKVASLNFSAAGRAKIEAVGGECLSIEEMAEQIPSGRGIRIIK